MTFNILSASLYIQSASSTAFNTFRNSNNAMSMIKRIIPLEIEAIFKCIATCVINQIQINYLRQNQYFNDKGQMECKNILKGSEVIY